MLNLVRVHFLSVHTEVTLYVLGVSMLLTIWLSADFHDFLASLSRLASDGEEVQLLFMPIFLIGAALSILAALVQVPTPIARSFAPLFVGMVSLALCYEYFFLFLGSTTVVQQLLLLYQALCFFIMFEVADEIVRNELKHAPQAQVREVACATLLVAVIFVISYGGYVTTEFSWIHPVMYALIFWQLLDRVFRRWRVLA